MDIKLDLPGDAKQIRLDMYNASLLAEDEIHRIQTEYTSQTARFKPEEKEDRRRTPHSRPGSILSVKKISHSPNFTGGKISFIESQDDSDISSLVYMGSTKLNIN